MTFYIKYIYYVYMKTKAKSNQEREQIIDHLLFWVIILIIAIVGYDDLTFNGPIMRVFWFASMLMIISWILCIDLPTGARKHRKRWFIPSDSAINDSKINQAIKEQNMQAIKIAVIWIVFLLIEGIMIHFDIITEKLVILGLIILRIADRLFIIVWCPFGAIMNNRCCTTCRIYGWDQAMLNSPLVFFPSAYSYTLIALSFIPFIEWEVAVHRHPERFFQMTNRAIRCSNCAGVCGRCKNKRFER